MGISIRIGNRLIRQIGTLTITKIMEGEPTWTSRQGNLKQKYFTQLSGKLAGNKFIESKRSPIQKK